MADKKIGDEAITKTLSKMELEIGRLKERVGSAVDADLLESLAASDGINQSCNGICGGVEMLSRASEAEVSRIVSAAAKYNIDQLKAVSALGDGIDRVSDSVNQGCNGIC